VEQNGGRVYVRTPAYRRPEQLRRCLESLIAQTWSDWVCDVFDDDPDESGRAVCAALDDARIRYAANRPRKFASANIDQCFSTANPHDADYFCVVEDDNYLLPGFMEGNIDLCRRHGVDLILRNQFVEIASGTPQARLSKGGVLDGQINEGMYEPALFRLVLLTGIGVSNGGLFWSRDVKSALEIGPCTATSQEYMRTFSVDEPILVALEPLGVWAENGEQTTRDIGNQASYLRRELDLKHRIQRLQGQAWRLAGPDRRRDYLRLSAFPAGPTDRAKGLAKALLASPRTLSALPFKQALNLVLRGLAIRVLGRSDRAFEAFMVDRERRRGSGQGD
jgi:glycosyltransferase involved in cell wall biosynthesis